MKKWLIVPPVIERAARTALLASLYQFEDAFNTLRPL
jgi:hypothetical protein